MLNDKFFQMRNFSTKPEVEILGAFGLIVSAGFSSEMLLTAKYETAIAIITIKKAI